jgi:hypothetical protein
VNPSGKTLAHLAFQSNNTHSVMWSPKHASSPDRSERLPTYHFAGQIRLMHTTSHTVPRVAQ